MSGIMLHKEHGLNPTMDTCFYCNKPKDILLIGSRVSKFKEAGLADETGRMNHQIGVLDMEPCSECAGYIKQGIILISCKDEDGNENEKEIGNNPYRTGGWIVIKEEALGRMINKELFEDLKKKRFAFVPDAVWDMLKLPRGEVIRGKVIQEEVIQEEVVQGEVVQEEVVQGEVKGVPSK